MLLYVKDKEDYSSSEEEENSDGERNEEEEYCVCLAQIVKFFEQMNQDGTVECSKEDTYCITIKQLYPPEDMTDEERNLSGTQSALLDEHYFRDFVDSVPIESIIGLAH